MPEEDAEVTAVKWMAYSRARRRNRKRAYLLTGALALPVAYLAWKSQSYHLVMDWMNIAGTEIEGLRILAEIVTVGWAWMITVIVQFPLRIYLRNRWAVNPERFGLSADGGNDA